MTSPSLVALKLAMSFALFLAKNVHLSVGEEFCTFPCQNVHLSFSPFNSVEFTLSVAKNVALFEVTGDRNSKTNDRNSGCTVLVLVEKIEKMNQIYSKNYWKEKKRLCVRLRSGDKHHLRKSADQKAQISSVSETNAFLICAFRSADFLRWCFSPERNLAHNLLFYFQ